MLTYLLIAFLVIFLVYSIWYYQLKSKAKVKAKAINALGPRKWETSHLERHRDFTDPLADAAVKAIFDNNAEDEINICFKYIRNNGIQLPKKLPPILKKYFEETAVLPDWADKDLIRFGQENYIRHGFPIGVLLFYKSLPECYTGAKGAEVLLRSTRMNDHSKDLDVFSKRMSETGLFIFDCMMPGGLEAGGSGIRTAQKVRLIHAVMRYFLNNNNWPTKENGEPINQEDMAGTLMSFSALILEGLQIIGINLDTTEAEAYIHCWGVIGHIMGVHPDLIPKNAADALALGHAIVDHQVGKSNAGVTLTSALLAFCDKKAPFFIKKEFHSTMMRLLMEDKYSDILEVPEVSNKKIKRLRNITHFLIRIREFLDHILIFALLIKWIDTLILKLSFTYLGQRKINYFFLPKTLTRDLN
jgi:hypothetical protein